MSPSRSTAPCVASSRSSVEIGPDRRERLALRPAIGGIDLLLGKVDARFDVHAQLRERVDDRFDARGEFAGERARRATRRFRARGVDQVGHALGLRQVETLVQEGAPREFAGLREPGAERHAAAQDLAQHDRAAVALQLEHVFAGVRMRGGKEEGDAFVEEGAAGARESRRASRAAASGMRPDDGAGDLARERARDADYADAAAARRRSRWPRSCPAGRPRR